MTDQLNTGQPNGKPNGLATPVPADALDIASLWNKTGAGDPLTHEVTHNIPVGRPRDFFRTAPDPAYRERGEVYVLKSENVIGEQFYLIGPALQGKIDEARPCILITVVDRTGAPRLWPLIQPREDERDNLAWSSARTVARAGLDQWVKLLWKSRAFVHREAEPGYAPEPDFGRLPPFNDLVRTAFGTHGVILDVTHPVYKGLLGKAALSQPNADPLL